jgi:polyhydroxybutyrate depolymerase
MVGCSGSGSGSAGGQGDSSSPSETAATSGTTVPASTEPPSTSEPSAEPAARPSAGCGAEAPKIDIGTYVEESRPAGDAMDYWRLRLPTDFSNDTPSPLVFAFHGAGSNPAQQVLYANFDAHADEDNAIIVAPKSRESAWRPLNGPDLELIDYLLTEIPKRFCVDLDRIYSTGMSSGAFTTATLACTHPGEFAAFAGVTANFYAKAVCSETEPIDIVTFHGTADPIVKFGDAKPIDGIPTEGGVAAGFATGWAGHDACDPEPVDEKIGEDVTKRTWPGCDAGGSVTFYVIDGGGHTWPGSIALPEERFGPTTATISATDLIWEFFMSHRLGD